jgi:hypothetical protein
MSGEWQVASDPPRGDLPGTGERLVPVPLTSSAGRRRPCSGALQGGCLCLASLYLSWILHPQPPLRRHTKTDNGSTDSGGWIFVERRTT